MRRFSCCNKFYQHHMKRWSNSHIVSKFPSNRKMHTSTYISSHSICITRSNDHAYVPNTWCKQYAKSNTMSKLCWGIIATVICLQDRDHLDQGWPTFRSESATERKVKAAGAAPRKYISFYKKHNLQYEINQCETWCCFCALRDEMFHATDEKDSSNTSFKWPSVSWALDFDLVSFILENSYSQQ